DASRMTRGQFGLLFLSCLRLPLIVLYRSPGAPLRTLLAFKTSFGTAAVTDGIPPEEYETWVGGFEDYPIDHRYYEVVHESLKDQCDHYYLFLKDFNGITRAIQPFLIVSQDIATGTPAFIRNALEIGR